MPQILLNNISSLPQSEHQKKKSWFYFYNNCFDLERDKFFSRKSVWSVEYFFSGSKGNPEKPSFLSPPGGLWWHFCIGVSLNPHHRFGRLITVFSFLPVEKQDRLYSKPGLLDSKVANTTCSALPIKYRTVSNSFHYSFNDYFRTIILYMPIFRACWPNNSLFSLRV